MAQIERRDSSVGRERILARIRRALQTPSIGHCVAETESRKIFEPVTNLLDRFQSECAANKTECAVAPDIRASALAIAKVLEFLPPGEVFIQDAPELREIASTWQEREAKRVCWSSEGPPKETVQATVTRAEALVAATGSVLFSAACGGREAAIVPPVHIVFATFEQLVPDIEAAFARARERGALRNSYLALISGSSRTADIEKILVMGAHGPRRLVVVLSLR